MTASSSPEETIRRFEQYSNSDPNNFDLLLQLADLYHRSGRFDDALNALQRCNEVSPGNVKARSRQGSVLISMHRFQEASNVLAELVAAGDTDPALQHNLGLALYFQHRFEEARTRFDLAEKRGLSAASNFAYLARSLHHLGEIDDALAAAKKWANAAPGVESKSYLALLYSDNGETSVATKLATEVLAEDPNNVDCNVVIGGTEMERQEAVSARKRFNVALRQDQENGRAWLGLGLVHLYDQEPQEAIAALSNAARIFPDNAGIAVTLGWAHVVANDPTTAERAFEAALDVDRNFAESHAGLAAARALQGKIDLAKESLALARRLDRHSIGADVAETFVLSAQGNQQAATDIFAAALRKSPGKDALSLVDQLRIYAAKKRPATRKGPRYH